jgi:hypothetical protein
MLIIHTSNQPINKELLGQMALLGATKIQENKDTQLSTIEYLRQIGKRVQIYWGTSYPKHFIRTFSELNQLLNNADGLSIRIIDEDNLQKVRLEIEPYKNSNLTDLEKIDSNTGTWKMDDKKPLIKTYFYITQEALKAIIDHFSKKNYLQNKFDNNKAIGIEFCIGKETSESEIYNYSIIIQAVNICNNRVIDEENLPIMIPNITYLIP